MRMGSLRLWKCFLGVSGGERPHWQVVEAGAFQAAAAGCGVLASLDQEAHTGQEVSGVCTRWRASREVDAETHFYRLQISVCKAVVVLCNTIGYSNAML